jgi:hypothetical protein
VSYLHQNDILERLGVVFHKHYRVLICLACGAAYLPADILGHLRNSHNIKANDQEVSFIHSAPETLGVVTDSGSVPLPASCGPPVEGLKKPQEGFRCCFCDYAVLKKRPMLDHFIIHRDEHSLAPVETRSRPAKVQAFWATINRVFFEVEPSLGDISSDSIWASYLSEEALRPAEELPAVPAIRPTEVPHLLKHTQWHTLLGDRIRDRTQREKLLRMVIFPKRGEGCLSVLPELCLRYFRAAVRLAQTAEEIVLMMIESFPVSVLFCERIYDRNMLKCYSQGIHSKRQMEHTYIT